MEINLAATVLETGGGVAVGATVSFTSERGTLSANAVETDSDGIARNTLSVSRDDVLRVTDGFFTVEALAVGADEGGTVSDSIDIEVGGFPADLGLTIAPGSIPQTGGVIQLSAWVTDAAGIPVEGVAVRFSPDVGTLASGTGVVNTDVSGVAVDTLNVTGANLSAVSGRSFRVRAEVGGGDVSDEATVLVEGSTPVAAFDFTINGNDVTFVNRTTGDQPIEYAWDFTNDGTTDSQSVSPTNEYPGPGNYDCKLTATNAVGTDEIIQVIVISPPPAQ